MDMQQDPMVELHNSFWRDDQVTILFQSSTPLVVDGIFNPKPLQEIDVRQQLVNINGFLQEQDIPATLHFLDDSDESMPNPSLPPPQQQGQRAVKMNDGAKDSQLPAGVYAFGFHTPIESSPGLIRTSVISFLKVEPNSSQGGSSSSSMRIHRIRDNGNGNGQNDPMNSLVVQIVQELNAKLPNLYERGIPITIATPTWLTGGTGGGPGGGQGCPLTPPMPVADSCSNWRFSLPHLSDDLKSKKGQGVTVFVLDSFPERGVIARAARLAGDDNPLLAKVNEAAQFDYSFMSGVQDVQEIGETNGTFVGKDVYGRHYPTHLEDHGLFIAGIIHDLAPRAQIECIRVLDDLCVGDVQVIAQAINQIYFRKALSSGDLYGKPVVVNLSLVVPTGDEAQSQGITSPFPTGSPFAGSNSPWASLDQPLRCLTSLGAIVVASAGNEGDQREVSVQYRPPALYPAAFAYPPFTHEGIIPVGAVDASGNVTSYSCYPGERGIATYGGETPAVIPPSPPYPTSGYPDVRPTDMMRGIYSSVEYPPLSLDPPSQYYSAPNDHAWAYWVGTSFATPVVASLAARVLELQAEGGLAGSSAQLAIMNAASDTTHWDRLDPGATGGSSTADGNMLLAVQHCVRRDRDEKDHEDEEEAVNVVVNVNEFNT